MTSCPLPVLSLHALSMLIHAHSPCCKGPMNEEIYSAGDDATIRQWDPKTGTLNCTMEGIHGKKITDMQFSYDKCLLVTSCADQWVRIDGRRGECMRRLSQLIPRVCPPCPRRIRSLTILPVCVPQLRLFSVKGGLNLLRQFNTERNINSAAVSPLPDCPYLIAGHLQRQDRGWIVLSWVWRCHQGWGGACRAVLVASSSPAQSCCTHPDSGG